MPVRTARLLLAAVLAAAALAQTPAPVAAAGPKVAIIVGPTGSITDAYRSRADQVAAAAVAAGATVAKAYSPRATWPRVLEAVQGANIIVYFGHGNGFPNPYGSTELRDRHNGWGLNTSTSNGDADSWSAGTLVYCGEKALLGTLGAYDGSQQRKYCTGGPIRPARNFVMIFGQAHYAPGFGERYVKSDPRTTYTQARQRVRNYSYPYLKLGASAFYATAYSDAHQLVARLLSHPNRTFGWSFKKGVGFDADALRKSSHPDRDAKIWLQKTVIEHFHFGQPDYWYAFAGKPGRTPAEVGLTAASVEGPRVIRKTPSPGRTDVRLSARPSATFSEPVLRINENTVKLVNVATGQVVPARVRYDADKHMARLIPDQDLQPGTTYRVKLAGWIRDVDDNRLGAVSWKFTTGT
ncbi:MAG TPA: Ig-like domain-containing protein [Candidatus Limnocylindria bacterium]